MQRDVAFWHGHPTRFRPPKSNTDYWDAEIARARDVSVTAALTGTGWTALRLWKYDLKRDFPAQFSRILAAIGREPLL